jgi:hypothetical protein
MKTFNQLREAVGEPDVVQGAIVNGVPTALVQHGSHAFKDQPDEPLEQGAMVDGVPCAVVFHGSHSVPKTRKLGEKFSVDHSTVKHCYFDENDNTHIHPDIHQVGKLLQHTQKREGLDSHHLNQYCSGSRCLNKALYDAHKNGKDTPKSVTGFGVEHNVRRLDDAIHRNKLHKDVHLYSGVGFEPSKLASNHPEGHIYLPAYTSTSINKSVARNFASNQGENKPTQLRQNGVMGHVLHIHAKAGQPAAYVDRESTYKHENEVLLPRGTTLKIHGHSEHEDEFGDVYRVHHSTIVK